MASSTRGWVDTVRARILNRRLRDVITPVDLTPLQVTVIYALLGFLALFLSDVALTLLVRDDSLLNQLQALKGGIEVVLTAGLIYVLTDRSRRRLEHRNDRLDAIRAERSVLYRVLRHNLRQDMTVIAGYGQLVMAAVDDADIETDIGTVIERASRVERYLDKVQRIERLLDTPVDLGEVDLARIVRRHPLINELAEDPDVTLSLDLPDRAPVVASPQVGMALSEVLENAREHVDAPAIEVVHESVGDYVRLAVTDDGPGIPAADRRAVDQMEEDPLSHSSGLGLWFVKLTCSVSGGKFEVDDRFADGSRVVLELPCAPRPPIWRRMWTALR